MKTVIIFAIAFGDAGGAEVTLHLNFLNHLKVCPLASGCRSLFFAACAIISTLIFVGQN